jgi:hypothetical protein
VARKSGRPFAQNIVLDGCVVAHDPKFLSENLTISPAPGKGPKYTFIFARSQAEIVAQAVQDLRVRISAPIWPLDRATVEAPLEAVAQ